MVDAITNTGTAGRLIIRDNGSLVQFIVECTDPQTRVNGYSGAIFVNGQNVPFNVNLPAGFGSRVIAQYTVTYSQQVGFTQAATNTQGLGGQASVTMNVARSSVPPAPTPYSPDQPTSSSLRFRFQSNGTGSGTLLRWEYQYTKWVNGAATTWSDWIPSSGTSVQSGLDRSSDYGFRARGVNTVGNGVISATMVGRTSDTKPDQPPAPSFSSITANSFNFNATNPAYAPGITSRLVQVATTDAFTSIIASSTAASGTIGSLSRTTDYWVRQRIQNAAGVSDWSVPVKVTTQATVPSAPSGYAPFNVASTSAFTTKGNIADNGGVTPNNMRIQVNTTASETGAMLITMGYWADGFMPLLTKGTQYYYRIAAGNPAGWSAYGPWVPFTTKTNVPNSPTGVTISSITDTSALASWTLPSQLNGSSITSVVVKIWNLSGLSREISLAPDAINQAFGNLPSGTIHFVQVWTTSTNGLGSASIIASFLTSGAGTGPKMLWRRINGVWYRVIRWQRINGVWRPLKPWRKIAGVWKNS